MNQAQSPLPCSVIHWLSILPTDRPIAALLRHAEREALPENDIGYTLPITDLGAKLSKQLGALMRGRLRTLQTSPLARCVQTAQKIREGAKVEIPVLESRLLGDPGIYVKEPDLAWTNWQAMQGNRIKQ